MEQLLFQKMIFFQQFLQYSFSYFSSLQQMFNFNNKKEVQEPSLIDHPFNSPQFQRCEFSKHKPNANKQINATQCLLLLSELEQNDDDVGSKFQIERQSFEVEVTPWVNSNFNIKQKTSRRPFKSKANIISQSCDQQIKIQPRNRQNRQSDDQKARNLMSKKSNRLKILKKQSGELKNSYSAIARYSDHYYQLSSEFNFQDKNEQGRKIYHLNATKSQLSHTPQPFSKKFTKKSDKQNLPEQIILAFANKVQDNINKIKIRKEQKYKNSMTDSVANQNIRVLSSVGNKVYGISTEESQFLDLAHCQSQIQNKKSNEKNLFREHSNRRIQQMNSCKSEFQNIIEGISKASQYQKIKDKILENIKKESVVQAEARIDMSMSINKSKKLIGRYFKQVQQKKLKNSHKSCMGNTNSTHLTNNSVKIGGLNKNNEVFDTGLYELNNPISKNLYQKYKILLNKGK